MQKLDRRDTYTPLDASQVQCNCDLSLNREETLSVSGLKTLSNDPEVNLSEHSRGLQPLIYVHSFEGIALMPCKPAKAKKLLENNKAIVIKYKPYTIQLLFKCENKVQNVKLGIDSGSKFIGFSAITDKSELISGTVFLDDKTSSRQTERRMYRRGRRNKKWYRKPRFLNRKKPAGWLPPSIQRKYDTHLNLISRIKYLLPITEITIEVGNFDMQKLENDSIEGVEYQQGDMYGYQNIRSFLMFREKGKCQLCQKEFSKGNPSHIHHCLPRSKRGSNSVKNLALLHKKCHENLHQKDLKISSPKNYRDSTFMNIIKSKFINDISDVKLTFGYKTFTDRIQLSIEKTHYNDAFVIAGGTNVQIRVLPMEIYQKQINNRTLQLNRNGFKPSIRKQRYSIRPKNIIKIDGKEYSVIGMQNKGVYVKLDGLKKLAKASQVNHIYHFGSLVFKYKYKNK